MMTSVLTRVHPFGLAERGHAVGDRFDAGDRRTTGRERSQQAEDREAVQGTRSLLAEIDHPLLVAMPEDADDPFPSCRTR